MRIVRTTAISLLALLTIAGTAADAFAGHRHRIWPRVYIPFISEFDGPGPAYYDDSEDPVIYQRRHPRRDIVQDYYDEQDLEPVYDPPVQRVVKPKKKVATKPVKKDSSTASVVVKPKVKPVTSKPVETASITATETGLPNKSAVVTSGKSLPDFQVKGAMDSAVDDEAPAAPTTTLSTKSSAVTPVVPKVVTPKAVTPIAPVTTAPLKTAAKPVTETPAAKTAPATTKVASAASPAATGATPKGAIACSKGAEIVSGYGFTSVKPKVCSGATYSFDASRAANAYVIKVSAATGEITDVQKLK